MTITREALKTMTVEDVKALRDSCDDRHFQSKGIRRWQATDVQKKAYYAEYKLLDDYYQENRVVSNLEKEFLATVDNARERMNAELKTANAALDRAVAISEKTGIPLDTGISPLGQTYTPDNSKFAELLSEECVCD